MRRESSREATSNNIEQQQQLEEEEDDDTLTRNKVAALMRAEDAELLESIHNLPSSSMTTPMLEPKNSEELSISPFSLDGLVEQASRTLIEDDRKALSGDVWRESHPRPFAPTPQTHAKPLERMDRRWSEAAQFAQAVGDMALDDQGDLMIIEEDGPGDEEEEEDDDNAPEIHIANTSFNDEEEEEVISIPPENIPEPRPTVEATEQPKPKIRPQWPFAHKLDPNQATPCEYKGIRANPIIQRGTNRGNYAVLHRKAWLEVSDKYHRYGKHLRIYYRHWESLGCPTNMFFDWLDSKSEAAGQALPNLPDCPRSKLDSDTVLYISNPEMTDGYALQFVPDKGRARVLDVDADPVSTGPDGWIFVLRDNVLYGAQKITSITGHSKQRFHHSSFFGGKAVQAAGIFLTDDDGFLIRLYPHSGHYRPGEAHMQRLLYFLHLEGVDLRTFQVDMQQILHVARDKDAKDSKGEKRKKIESLHLMPGVLVACFLAHKARFIEYNFGPIRQIRKSHVATVQEALKAIRDYQRNRRLKQH